jgi:hypothetical protein
MTKRKRKLPFGNKTINSYLVHPDSIKREVKSEFLDYEIESVKIKFPFEPYESQKNMMEKIIKCIRKSENALLESPTGTGKTLALLVASLAWQKADMNTPSVKNEGLDSDLISPYFASQALESFKSDGKAVKVDVDSLLAQEKREKKVKTIIYFAR